MSAAYIEECKKKKKEELLYNSVEHVMHRGCLHGRYSIQIPVRIGVRFAAKGVQQVNFFSAEMYEETIVMGDSKRIGSPL
jgi:hypothetical protein